MVKYFINVLKKIRDNSGFYIVKETPRENILNTIKKLRPYKTQKELIRLGPSGDGGYLLPNDLEGILACYSPGVDQISGFEEDCIKRGIKVFMADNTVEKPNLDMSYNQFGFIRKHINSFTNSDFITMDGWANQTTQENLDDLLLQMDIEGAEYVTLINMSEELFRRFRIIIVEFHTLDEMWNPFFFKLAENVFQKILQTHKCVHIHPNNDRGIYYRKGIGIPRTAEFTFLRNDRSRFDKFATEFPHTLDSDNAEKKPVTLPDIWFKS